MRRKPVQGWQPEATRRELAARQLAAQRAERPDGRLPYGAVRDVAEALGISRSQVRRDAHAGTHQRRTRKRFEINEHDRAALIASDAAFHVAHEALVKAGWPGHDTGVGYVQFTRAIHRDVSEADLLLWEFGEQEARQAELKLRHCQPRLPGLYFDAKQYSVWVRHPEQPDVLIQPFAVKGKWTQCAYATRPACSPDPPTHHVVGRAIQNALGPDPSWGPAHGLPAFIGHDNGSEFLADHLTLMLIRLALPNRLSKAYHASENGPIESLHRWEEAHYCVPHPYYAHGPARVNGTAIMPDLDRAPHYETWRAEMEDDEGFLWHYNHGYTGHEELGGKTPVQAFLTLPEPPSAIEAAAIRWIARDPYRVIVNNDGVRVLNATYQDEEFDGRTGQYVMALVDERKNDAEIFTDDGEWLCTAINQRKQTDNQRLAVITRRTASRARATKELKAVLARIEAGLPITAGALVESESVDAVLERFRHQSPSGFNQALEED
jgi:hypothetical protein